jgi:hypothetical protein
MNVAALAGSVGQLHGFARSDAAGSAAPAAQPPQEPYLSPVVQFDKQARVVVFQFRDAETGNVTRQYPSERVVKLYRDSAHPEAATSPEKHGGDEEPAAAPVKTGTGSGSAEATTSTPTPAPKPSTGGTGGERVRLTA